LGALRLAIAHSLLEAHGGQIWAKSAEGEGSTFGFSLPAAIEPEPV
jgi:signal transduction histidine kinase